MVIGEWCDWVCPLPFTYHYSPWTAPPPLVFHAQQSLDLFQGFFARFIVSGGICVIATADKRLEGFRLFQDQVENLNRVVDEFGVILVQGVSINELIHLLFHALRDVDIGANEIGGLARFVSLGHKGIGERSDRHVSEEDGLTRRVTQGVQKYSIVLRGTTEGCVRQNEQR